MKVRQIESMCRNNGYYRLTSLKLGRIKQKRRDRERTKRIIQDHQTSPQHTEIIHRTKLNEEKGRERESKQES